MRIVGLRYLLLILLLLVGHIPCSLAAPTEGKSAAEAEMLVTLDFQDVDLIDMINTISELTGKNFVYDESVRGKVSVVSPKPVSVDEAFQLFSTVLNIKGYTIIPSGRVNKIVATRSAKEENLPVTTGRSYGEQYVTRLIKLKNLNAEGAVDTILRPLIPKTSHVVAHAASNTVVITDSAANIERLMKILTALDRSWDGEKVEIVTLQHSDAEEITALVMQILEGGTAGAGDGKRGAQNAANQKSQQGQVLPYERSNKLLLQGDEGFIARVKELISRLDEKTDQARNGVYVYYLENADAEELAETLNKVVSGSQAQQATQTAAGKAAAGGEGVFGELVITADKPTNSIIVNAAREDYEKIHSIVAQLDVKRKQVFVEALILEVSMDALLELGASLQGAVDVGSDSVAFGTSNQSDGGLEQFVPDSDTGVPSVLSAAVDGILLGGLFNPITTVINGEEVTIPALSALIQLSQSDNNLNVLSAPRLLTSDNEEAEIVVGSNVPIITSKSKDNDGNPINSVERKDVALTLKFTPQITEGDLVRLKIYQEISDLAPTSQSVGTVDEVGPTFTTRKLSNSIVAKDGKTVVLGGLFQTTRQEIRSKVPLLGDIPLLGYLFRSKSEQEEKTSLLIFITPRVIRSSEDLERITLQNRKSLEAFQQAEGSTEIFDLEGLNVNEPGVENIEKD